MIYTEAQRREHVRGLQRDLRIIGLAGTIVPLVAISGTYDSTTAAAVRDFQKKNGLPVNGQTDLATWQGVVEASNRLRALGSVGFPVRVFPGPDFTLQPGDSGRSVYLLQALLNGLPPHFQSQPLVPFTGVYDTETAAAVSAMQRTLRLPATGVLNRASWDGLAALFTGYGRSAPLSWAF